MSNPYRPDYSGQYPWQPGWYPDPLGGGETYFDGVNWTPFRRSIQQPKRFTINYGFALLAFFSLLALLFFGIPLVSNGATTFGTLWIMWSGMWMAIWSAFAVQHMLRGGR